MRLTFEWVGTSRLPTPIWVGLTQFAEGLNWAKTLTLLQVKDISPCLTAFQLEYSFPPLPLNLNWNVLPGSLACWISNWSYTLSSPGFWASWLQILELVSPRNYMNQSYNNNNKLYWFLLVRFSGETWLMQWPTQDIICHFCCSYTFSLYQRFHLTPVKMP